MASPTTYLDAFDRLTETFANTFARYDARAFNAPYDAARPDSWTPGQVVQHLLLSETATMRLLTGPTEAEEGRGADNKCAAMWERFVEDATPYPAMAGLLPPAETYSPERSLEALMDSRGEIRTAYEFSGTPEAVSKRFEHPLFGHLTRCEWMYFTAIHGERHRRQVG